MGGCHYLLSIYDAPKASTVYVVKSSVLGLQRAFSRKVKVVKLEIINKIIQKKFWVSVIIYYWFMMPQSLVLCNVVKLPILGLQRVPENSELAPSVLDLYQWIRI